GWQQERYPENDFFTLPLIPELDSVGKPVTVTVALPGRELALRVWRIQVGRVPLYLLDANIPQNSPHDRAISSQLHGRDLQPRRPPIEAPTLDFAPAFGPVKAGTSFTTPTPVPAGNDAFPMHMIEQYLGEYMARMGVDRNTLASLGRQHPGNEQELFSMTV